MTLARVDVGHDALVGWSEQATAAANIARALAPTPFVPDSLRVFDRGHIDLQATTATVAAALLTGHELGLTPMASVRSIDVIKGTPALRAVALRALLQRAGHKMWLVESTKTRCVMRGRRAGDDHDQEVTWTLDRAKDLGVVSKDNWRRQPQNMLIARATAELARLIAADAILGLPYIAEEVADQDGDTEDGTGPAGLPPTEPAPSPRRTARRRTPPGSAKPAAAGGATLAPTQASPFGDEPDLDEPAPAPAPPPDPDAAMITGPQRKALWAGLRDIGLTDRDEALAQISAWIGRDIASTDELYRAEATTAIEATHEVKNRQAAEEQVAEHGEEDEPQP